MFRYPVVLVGGDGGEAGLGEHEGAEGHRARRRALPLARQEHHV